MARHRPGAGHHDSQRLPLGVAPIGVRLARRVPSGGDGPLANEMGGCRDGRAPVAGGAERGAGCAQADGSAAVRRGGVMKQMVWLLIGLLLLVSVSCTRPDWVSDMLVLTDVTGTWAATSPIASRLPE